MANGLIHNRFNWLGLNKKYKSIYKTQNPQKSKVLLNWSKKKTCIWDKRL